MLTTVDQNWTDPVTTTSRILLQVKSGGPGLISLGNTEPVSEDDGADIMTGEVLFLEVGSTYRLRAAGAASTVFYIGEIQ